MLNRHISTVAQKQEMIAKPNPNPNIHVEEDSDPAHRQSVPEHKGSITRKLHGIHTVCTTADIWIAHHRSYLGITCHWIEPETLERKLAALACERIRGRHTYDVIATKMSKIHVYTPTGM